MKCPRCGENTPDAWQILQMINRKRGGEERGNNIRGKEVDGSIYFTVDWMFCEAEQCGQTLIRIRRTLRLPDGGTGSETWLAVPRTGLARPIDPSVPDYFRNLYVKASAILDLSSEASAILSRRILADLLDQYAHLTDFRLVDRIDKFNSDTTRPFDLRKNLQYVRETADLSAHTKTDDQANVIEVSREDAEWALDVIERLFHYFIVTPHKDREMRQGIEAKAQAANRKSIPPLPDER